MATPRLRIWRDRKIRSDYRGVAVQLGSILPIRNIGPGMWARAGRSLRLVLRRGLGFTAKLVVLSTIDGKAESHRHCGRCVRIGKVNAAFGVEAHHLLIIKSERLRSALATLQPGPMLDGITGR